MYVCVCVCVCLYVSTFVDLGVCCKLCGISSGGNSTGDGGDGSNSGDDGGRSHSVDGYTLENIETDHENFQDVSSDGAMFLIEYELLELEHVSTKSPTMFEDVSNESAFFEVISNKY